MITIFKTNCKKSICLLFIFFFFDSFGIWDVDVPPFLFIFSMLILHNTIYNCSHLLVNLIFSMDLEYYYFYYKRSPIPKTLIFFFFFSPCEFDQDTKNNLFYNRKQKYFNHPPQCAHGPYTVFVDVNFFFVVVDLLEKSFQDVSIL